ncbi:MAG: tRNA (adenosine(37)-N6)-dimethylallyltransferase MiaA [bacterium]|nr:tRNA (adenosine(37)-N6)-dimethylallyltransferase MiaA [bacterium]
MNKTIVVIGGPTSVGKTQVAVALCERFGGEIVFADSKKIYKGMDIGTSKPSEEIKNKVRCHLIDVVLPSSNFSVADFKQLAEEKIDEIHNRGRLPFLVGGTGLYIKAIVKGLFPCRASSQKIRNELNNKAKEFGTEYLYNELCKVDREKAREINPQDLRRISRALEVYYLTGKPISFHQRHNTKPAAYHSIMIALYRDRKELYNRIEERVDRMIEEGLRDEVKGLLEEGYNEDLVSMEGIGYKQIIGYLKGEYTMDHAIYLIKRDTRRLAKRQLTWFRGDTDYRWFHADQVQDITNYIKDNLMME